MSLNFTKMVPTKPRLIAAFLAAASCLMISCQATGPRKVTQDAESLYISSQFKPLSALGDYSILPISVTLDRDGNEQAPDKWLAGYSEMPAFDYNLLQMVREVADEYIDITETISSNTSIIFYTDIDSQFIPLSNEASSLVEREHLIKINQSFVFYSFSQGGELVRTGEIDYYFNTFDSNASSDLRKLREIYRQVLSFFGESTESREVVDFPQGILQGKKFAR